jgi:hypothetical protein
MLVHLAENPCLYQSWSELWSELQKHGWEKVNLVKEKLVIEGLPENIKQVYIFRDKSVKSWKIGVQVFASKFALMKYIARFPYLLQERLVFNANLERLGWSRCHGDIVSPSGFRWSVSSHHFSEFQVIKLFRP